MKEIWKDVVGYEGLYLISILNGKTKRWGSSVEAEMFFSGKATGNISKCLRGKSPKSYGYKWEYAEVQNG